MKHSFYRLNIAAPRVGWRQLARDVRGVAAVEFGLIAPVLLIMLVGVFEVTRAISIDRRFGQVTSMVADLIAREENITAADVNAIYGIVDHVMGVWGTDTLKLHVIPVRAKDDDATVLQVYAEVTNRPSYGAGEASLKARCDQYNGLSNDLLGAGGTAIVVEAEYNYNPLIVGGLFAPKAWKDKAVLAPRNSCVDFDDNNCLPNPPCP